MKKYSIRISFLSIAFSVIFLVILTGTKAETQDGPKKDLVSELNLEHPGLANLKSHSMAKKGLKDNSSREFLIPLKEGLNVVIDCASPPHQVGLTTKDTRTNYRTVIGFHVSLR